MKWTMVQCVACHFFVDVHGSVIICDVNTAVYKSFFKNIGLAYSKLVH